MKDRIILSYIAGFLDGDGCISIHAKKPETVGYSQRFCGYVRFSNTNKEVLIFIQSQVGGSLFSEPRPRPRKILHTLRLQGYRATLLLEALLPFLRIKKLEAEIALKLMKRLKNWKTRNRISKYELKKREELLLACSSAKKQR